jgi:hypothetical protein
MLRFLEFSFWQSFQDVFIGSGTEPSQLLEQTAVCRFCKKDLLV